MDQVTAQRAKRQARVEDAVIALFARVLRRPLRRDRTLDLSVTLSERDHQRAVSS